MANPTMNENLFDNNNTVYIEGNSVMTLNGTILKSIFLLLFTCTGGAYTWLQFLNGNIGLANVLMIAGTIIGFILAMVICFKRTTAPYLAPIYAVMEGLFLGGISAITEAQYPGIVSQAVLGSLAAMFSVLALYMSKVIRVTDKLRSIIFILTASICVVYLVAFILSFFKINMPFLFDATPLSIGISIFVIIIAASNFLLDFDIIERGVAAYAPKYMEWYCSFGILVTLVWLYIEVLKLLSKLNSRR